MLPTDGFDGSNGPDEWGMAQMLKRIAAILAIAAVGLVASTGTAAAAPIYAPSGLSAVAISGSQVLVTGTNFGDETGPDEVVVLSVAYGSPGNVRQTFTVTPDENGNFSVIFDILSDQTMYIEAVGAKGGEIEVTLASPTGSGAGSGSGSGYVASTAYATGSSGYTGLASTGASIAAPLAIGLAVLLAGLALLFFGTRGVLRRKEAKEPTSG